MIYFVTYSQTAFIQSRCRRKLHTFYHINCHSIKNDTMLLQSTHTYTQEKNIYHTYHHISNSHQYSTHIYLPGTNNIRFFFVFFYNGIFFIISSSTSSLFFFHTNLAPFFFVFLITRTIDSVPVKYHEPRTAAVAPYNKKMVKKQ